MFPLLQSEANAAVIDTAGWVVLLVSLAVTVGWLYYVAR
jgi:hypothetical protein